MTELHFGLRHNENILSRRSVKQIFAAHKTRSCCSLFETVVSLKNTRTYSWVVMPKTFMKNENKE